MFGDTRFRGAVEDIPVGAGSSYEKHDMSNLLPRSLYGRYELISFEPKGIPADPVVLRNQWHQIIYQWPDDFIPSWGDVLNVCNQLDIK